MNASTIGLEMALKSMTQACQPTRASAWKKGRHGLVLRVPNAVRGTENDQEPEEGFHSLSRMMQRPA